MKPFSTGSPLAWLPEGSPTKLLSGIRSAAISALRSSHFLLPALTVGCLFAVTLPVHADAVLRKGDTLELKISGVPAAETTSLSGQYTIDNDGFVNLAYIGKIRIGGLPAGVAQSTIEQAYRSRDIFTNPTIIITQQIT